MLDRLQIIEETNLFHDNILDIWGNEFNFSHEKGLAEWLKNSIDAYKRAGISDSSQYIIFRFYDTGASKNQLGTIECLDFVGMEYEDIQKAFKWWGDPNAAKRGLNIKTYGGHGNGGKFYMRQLFDHSMFITFRKGKLNIFGFNEKKKYGFLEGFENKSSDLDSALKLAGVSKENIPDEILKLMISGELGFTLVKGVKPKKIAGKIPLSTICERLKYHPQARRPLKYTNVSVTYNGKSYIESLKMEDIEPLTDFETPEIFEIPEFVESRQNSGEKINMSDRKYAPGRLVLRTSSQPFGRTGKKAELNCIDFIGEVGVIGSYRMNEIGALRYYPQAQYIYGECTCPILEDPDYDSVSNDRDKLVENDRTRLLLEWVATKIDELGEKVAAQEQKDVEKKNIQVTDEFNKILNSWKNQFMSRIFTEVFGGPGRGVSTGGLGDEGSGGGKNDEAKDKGGLGSGAGKGGGEGEEKKSGSGMPRVLLSGQEDPDFPGVIVSFSERHFPVEQRQQDVNKGIYWINMDKPMAKKIIDKYGVDSPRWRNYLFQRYVDIFISETVFRLEKKEGGTLSAQVVDREIMRIGSIVYDKATVDLEEFLLSEKYDKETEKQEKAG
jgi:hypothetical protein